LGVTSLTIVAVPLNVSIGGFKPVKRVKIWNITALQGGYVCN